MRSGWVLLCLLVVAAVPRARADDAYTPPDFMTTPPPLPPSAGGNVWKLSLSDALQIALHENLGIQIERDQVQIGHLAELQARGHFEPTLTAAYLHTTDTEPPLTLQEGAAGALVTDSSDDFQVSLGDTFETGTQVSLTLDNGRSASTLGTAVEPLNYRTTLTVGFTQPLLRGFSTDLVIPRIDILRARIASDRERAQLAVVAQDVVEQTEDAYWDVVQALYGYDLQVRSHKRAEDQLALTKRQIAAGTLPPSDIIAAQSTLAQRELGLVQAEEQIHAAWDQLRAVMNLPRDQWSRPILPTEVPRFEPQATSPEDALQTAVENRPDLAQAGLDLKSELLSLRQAKNNELPQIDLGLNASAIGQDAHYGGAVRELGRVDAAGWSVQVNMSWTPLSRATRAAAQAEAMHYTQLQKQREQLVQTIWLAVRDAVRNQRGAARLVTAAAKSRELAEQTLELEQRKFLNGNSSQFVIAQRQEELAAAQLAELTAVLGHLKARAALLHATGRLLAEHGVVLEK